ncbi:hypothetical protein Hanom_Chr04g00320771 [Helianthus anomalus]
MIAIMILMRIQQGVKEIPELFIVGRPDVTIMALGSNVGGGGGDSARSFQPPE